ACPSWARLRSRLTWRKTGDGLGGCSTSCGFRSRATGRLWCRKKRPASRGRSGCRCWYVRATCSADGMVIAYDVNTVQEYVAQAALMGPARPVLIDQFLEEATEVDVDALADGADVVIGGIMEHIEEAGVHSGDSSCVLPPVSLSPAVLDTIRD